MSGPKSGSRLIALVITGALTVATLTIAANAATDTYQSTIKFLSDKFIDGKALDGFSPGKPDYGFTLEAILQRKAAGQRLKIANAKSPSDDLSVAAQAVLADTTTLARSVVATYAYSAEKIIKPGLAGKFLFVSSVIGVPNAPLKNSVIADLKKAIAADGTILLANGNSFDYAWVILGLATNGQPKLANQVAVKLATLKHPDGGFGMDQPGTTPESSTDATGIALQALALAKKTGTTSQVNIEQTALIAAARYLRNTQVSKNHWESWGDYDLNGSAYAAMGLKAAGANITAIRTWLKGKLAPNGGFMTPWSKGVGDVFATAQGYAPLIGLSYLDLIPKKQR